MNKREVIRVYAQITVARCSDCPFDYDDTCTLTDDGRLIYINSDGTSADIPDWCPLRKRDVRVSLAEAVE